MEAFPATKWIDDRPADEIIICLSLVRDAALPLSAICRVRPRVDPFGAAASLVQTIVNIMHFEHDNPPNPLRC